MKGSNNNIKMGDCKTSKYLIIKILLDNGLNNTKTTSVPNKSR